MVQRYLSSFQSMLKRFGKTPVFGLSSTVESEVEHEATMAYLWRKLRDARLIFIPTNTFAQVYHLVDVWTVEKVMGEKWAPPQAPLEDDKGWEYVNKLTAAAQEMPFPDPLPFPVTYFGYGDGLYLSDTQMSIRNIVPTEDVRGVKWSAHVITQEGLCAEILEGVNEKDETMSWYHAIYRMPPHLAEPRWADPLTLVPWIVTGLNVLVNAYRSVVIETPMGLGNRQDFRKLGKKLRKNKPIPRPYYKLTLKNEVVARTLGTKIRKEPSGSWSLSHQFDVRSHDRIRIQRGPLPLEEDVQQELLRRGYHIFEGELDEATQRKIGEKVVKQPDEWMAVLSTRIKSYRKGPKDAPYVPAVWKVPEGPVRCIT